MGPHEQQQKRAADARIHSWLAERPTLLRTRLHAGGHAVKVRQTFRGVVLKNPPPARIEPPRPATGPGPAKVRVGREVSGRSGKGVAVISGLPLGAAAMEELATRLKKLCGAGGAVKNGAIEIQGDHRDRLVAELIRLGYDAKKSGG